MMNKKMLVAGLVGVTLSAVASTSMAAPAAGLTLSSSGAPANIAVFCNGKKGLYDIPANGSLNPLPWGAIILMFGSSNLQCTFKLDNASQQVVGTANLSMTLSTGKVSNASTSAGYSVNINPGQGQSYSGISVNLQKS